MSGLTYIFSYIASHIFPEPIFVLILVVLLLAVLALKFRASLPVGLMLGGLVLYDLVVIGFGSFWVPLFYLLIALGGGAIVYGILKIAGR